jgi:hypothetical protein
MRDLAMMAMSMEMMMFVLTAAVVMVSLRAGR